MSQEYRKKLQHYEQERHLHELTFSCYGRRQLLTEDTWKRYLSASLKLACVEEKYALVAFVFMPEHVHLLVLPQGPDSRVSRFLGRTKQMTSKRIRQDLGECHSKLQQDLTVEERLGKATFRFWQAGGGFDRNLFSNEAISNSINYIHTNPVKRGLCRRATEFKWSSARFHELRIVDPDLPELIRPDPEWFH